MGKSLKDIAEALKVSKTTVSWVLSGRGDEQKISSATQKKIIDYAHKKGAIVIVDAAQSIPHMKIDVEKLRL